MFGSHRLRFCEHVTGVGGLHIGWLLACVSDRSVWLIFRSPPGSLIVPTSIYYSSSIWWFPRQSTSSEVCSLQGCFSRFTGFVFGFDFKPPAQTHPEDGEDPPRNDPVDHKRRQQ
ncbi:unnamed protein product, partial [Pylaiella littoralis]